MVRLEIIHQFRVELHVNPQIPGQACYFHFYPHRSCSFLAASKTSGQVPLQLHFGPLGSDKPSPLTSSPPNFNFTT